MFAKTTQNLIEGAISSELENAVKVYGKEYHSLHEGYAVLKEELEEADNNLKEALEINKELWEDVKADNDTEVKSDARRIAFYAYYLAMEAVQVVAVCKKIMGEE